MRIDRSVRYAFLIACITLVGTGLGFRMAVGHLNYYLSKERVDLREHFATIPRALGAWRALGPDAQLDSATLESLGTDFYLDRTYTDGENVVMFHLAYYTGIIDAIPHVPDRCMVAGGFRPITHAQNLPLHLDKSRWREDPQAVNRKSDLPYPTFTFAHRITGRPLTVRMPLGEFRVRTTAFHMPAKPDEVVYAGFFFIANGHTTPDPVGVRMLAFDKTDKYAYYCKIMFTMAGDTTMNEERFVDAVSSLLDEVLPEIMRCLPDWAEVEAEQVAAAAGNRRSNGAIEN